VTCSHKFKPGDIVESESGTFLFLIVTCSPVYNCYTLLVLRTYNTERVPYTWRTTHKQNGLQMKPGVVVEYLNSFLDGHVTLMRGNTHREKFSLLTSKVYATKV
jgi:hypothetical protein